MNQSLEKVYKKILIVGSSSYVGKALIKDLSKNNQLICVDKIIDKKQNSKNIIYLNSDVTSERKLRSLKKLIQKKIKYIDIIINCFVDQNYLSFERQTFKKFSSALNTNVSGNFLVTKIFHKLMVKSNNPQIINFGSIYGIISGDPKIYPNNKVTSDVYAASKAAIIQLTKYYAVHLSKYKIRVNCISPGGIFNHQNKKLVKNYIKKVPLNRMANINEIVESVKFLMSDRCKYLNGHNLIIDGGLTSW